MMRYSALAKAGSPGLGVSLAGSASAGVDGRRQGQAQGLHGRAGGGRARRGRRPAWWGRERSGRSRWWRGRRPARRRWRASACGAAVALRNRPPLMRETWRRTVFISWMSAPHLRSPRDSPVLSASVRPGAGAAQSADAPPDSSTRTRSRSVAVATRARARSAACTLASSGVGCRAETMSMTPGRAHAERLGRAVRGRREARRRGRGRPACGNAPPRRRPWQRRPCRPLQHRAGRRWVGAAGERAGRRRDGPPRPPRHRAPAVRRGFQVVLRRLSWITTSAEEPSPLPGGPKATGRPATSRPVQICR